MVHSSDLTDRCWVVGSRGDVGESALSLSSMLLIGIESLASTQHGATAVVGSSSRDDNLSVWVPFHYFGNCDLHLRHLMGLSDSEALGPNHAV